MIKIGAHVSAAENLSSVPLAAKKIGCECFQFFSRPPQGGPIRDLGAAEIKGFKANLKKTKGAAYIHAPYYINLASANNRIFYGSISVLRAELERGSRLGVKCLMTHLGSAKDLGEKEGLKKVIGGIKEILKDYIGRAQFLIEMSAGSGQIIGDTFEEIAKIIFAPALKKFNIGICFDTAHAFASGYDLRSDAAVKKTFAEFDRVLGLEKLKLIHANDSLADLGARKDQHAHWGEGKVGLAGLAAIVKLAKKVKVDLILETPHDRGLLTDLKIIKKLRGR